MIEKPRGKKGGRAVRVYDPGMRRKVYVGTRYTLREARQLEREKELEFSAHGRAPSVRQAEWTIRAWSKVWLERYPRPEESTRRYNRQIVNQLVASVGDVRLDRLSRREARLIALESRHVAVVASVMFNDAIYREEVFRGPNPFERLNVSKGRGRSDYRMLTEPEILALADCAKKKLGAYGEHFRALILFSAYVGARPGEVFGLRWTDFDFDKGTVLIERQRRPDGMARTKTKKSRLVGLPDTARDVVLGMDFRGVDWVFVTPSGTQMTRTKHRYYWVQVRDRFTDGLEEDHWLRRRIADGGAQYAPYELRHLCGSLLADRGLSDRDIAHQLGNSPEVCRETYIHTYEESARGRILAAMNRSVRPVSDIRDGSTKGSTA